MIMIMASRAPLSGGAVAGCGSVAAGVGSFLPSQVGGGLEASRAVGRSELEERQPGCMDSQLPPAHGDPRHGGKAAGR